MIVAHCGRALAQSARNAGLSCVVLDCFGDEDTRACADAVEVVGTAEAGFDRDRLLAAVDRWCLAGAEIRIVPGSGFEDRPELLAEIAPGRHLAGCSPETIRQIKNPVHFFAALDRLNIPHPEICLEAPAGCAGKGSVPRFRSEQASLVREDASDGLRVLSPSCGTDELLEGHAPGEGWLVKLIGGCGGTHIRRWRPGEPLAPGYFLQREVQGTPMSAVALSNGRFAQVIGYNELWLDPTAGQAFRFGGAVSVWPDPAVQSALASAAQDLLQLYDLIGLFGIDWVPDSTGEIAILEVNPRPPASFPLHEGKSSLLAAHQAACAGELPAWTQDHESQRALAIVYAGNPLTIPPGWHWPDWAADRPAADTTIQPGEPVCTVYAEGATPQAARDLTARRLRSLLDKLQSRQSVSLPLPPGRGKE